MKDLSEGDRLLIRDVFIEITEAAWFKQNAVTERELLILIINKRSSSPNGELLAECIAEARARFSS